jgi:NAD(P)-dependent dehydrogenase (short-subunit alcohol dehydrogenase family)
LEEKTMRLQNKVALVTGGGAGMGEAVSKAFAREGAKVIVADRHPEHGQAVVAAIQGAGGAAHFVQVDVAKAVEVEAMVAAAMAQYGRLDILYNNAAVQLHGKDARAHEVSEEIWEQTFNINLKGVWLCSKYAIPHMLKQGGGSIIQVASPTGLTGCAPGYTAYSSSKGGVFALTRVMAVDYARDNIRVNAVVPGATATPLIAEMLADDKTRQELENLSPLGRLGQPEDIVGLAVFLASDESSFCTGGTYVADGGLTAV